MIELKRKVTYFKVISNNERSKQCSNDCLHLFLVLILIQQSGGDYFTEYQLVLTESWVKITEFK